MRQKRFNPSILILVISIILLLVSSIIYLLISQGMIVDINYKPRSDPEREKRFIQFIGNEIDINSGMTLKKIEVSYMILKNTKDPQFVNVEFFILNHTNETIILPEKNDGKQIFFYNDQTQSWVEIQNINNIYTPNGKIIQPNENYIHKYPDNFNITNIRNTYRNKFVRLFLSGSGIKSGKRYGAWIDFFVY